MKYRVLIFAVFVVIGLFFIKNYFGTGRSSGKRVTMFSGAASSSAILTERVEWEIGTLVSTDTLSSPGNVKIDFNDHIFTEGIVTFDGSGDIENVYDDNAATYVEYTDRNQYLTWNLEDEYTVRLARVCTNAADLLEGIELYFDGSWHAGSFGNTGINCWTDHIGHLWWGGDQNVDGVSGVRFKSLDPLGSPWPGWTAPIHEFQVYTSSASATHTSAASQITNTNLYQWQTFTPTYTEPANTDISFKFRTSTNAIDWTAWTASQTVASGGSLDLTSLVTSKTGDPGSETFYKYIQVETTLTSTDGVSTPTLSDYTIGYHTNVAPNTPTAMTAVVGE